MIYAVISVLIVVAGAVVGFIKKEKIKAAAQIAVAGLNAAGAALAPGDDTPGKITPEEWGEIVEKIGQKAKEVGGSF